jgi:hypothetical protein
MRLEQPARQQEQEQEQEQEQKQKQKQKRARQVPWVPWVPPSWSRPERNPSRATSSPREIRA